MMGEKTLSIYKGRTISDSALIYEYHNVIVGIQPGQCGVAVTSDFD